MRFDSSSRHKCEHKFQYFPDTKLSYGFIGKNIVHRSYVLHLWYLYGVFCLFLELDTSAAQLIEIKPNSFWQRL